MKRTDFYLKLIDALELSSDFSMDAVTNLKNLEEYDSISIMSIIALIDEYFGKKLNANEFKEITTVNDLMEKIGSENFE